MAFLNYLVMHATIRDTEGPLWIIQALSLTLHDSLYLGNSEHRLGQCRRGGRISLSITPLILCVNDENYYPCLNFSLPLIVTDCNVHSHSLVRMRPFNSFVPTKSIIVTRSSRISSFRVYASHTIYVLGLTPILWLGTSSFSKNYKPCAWNFVFDYNHHSSSASIQLAWSSIEVSPLALATHFSFFLTLS